MYRLEAFQAHETGHWQRQVGYHLAVARAANPALGLAQAVDRGRHVDLIRADHAQIVAVVADGGSDRAALHAKAFDEGRRVIVIDAVTRDDRDLDHVLAQIDPTLAVFERQRHRNALGDDLARNDADRLRRRPL